MRSVSVKRGKRLREWAKVRHVVLLRAEGCCEARLDDVCTVGATQVHHVIARSHGGEDSPDNLLALCGPDGGRQGCHAYIHANPAEAHRLGLIAW